MYFICCCANVNWNKFYASQKSSVELKHMYTKTAAMKRAYNDPLLAVPMKIDSKIKWVDAEFFAFSVWFLCLCMHLMHFFSWIVFVCNANAAVFWLLKQFLRFEFNYTAHTHAHTKVSNWIFRFQMTTFHLKLFVGLPSVEFKRIFCLAELCQQNSIWSFWFLF